MTTSGVITSSITVREIVTEAFSIMGVFTGGSIPDTNANEAMRALSWAMKSMQADGMNLWRQLETTTAFPAATATVTLDPRVVDVVEARWIESSTYERSLGRWEWGEYVTMPNKISAGDPTIFVLKKLVSSITMTIWPVPELGCTIKHTDARIFDDVTAMTQTVDLPQQWQEAVYYDLADRLAGRASYGLAGTPVGEKISQTAAALYQKMLDSDRPASVFFQGAGSWSGPGSW